MIEIVEDLCPECRVNFEQIVVRFCGFPVGPKSSNPTSCMCSGPEGFGSGYWGSEFRI